VQESQAPAAPGLLPPQRRGFSRRFGFCLRLNRAACSRELVAPAAFRPPPGSSTLLPASPALAPKPRRRRRRSPSCSPVVPTLSYPMGKPGRPRGALLLTQTQGAPESSTLLVPPPCESPPGMATAQRGAGSEPLAKATRPCTLRCERGLCATVPIDKSFPETPRAIFGAAPMLSWSCSHVISAARRVLAMLVGCWVPSTLRPGAELPAPRSWASPVPTATDACRGRTTPPNHPRRRPWPRKSSPAAGTPRLPGPRAPLGAAARCRGVVGCSSSRCCRAAFILLQVAAIQCRIYSALTLSCQEGAGRLMGWAGSCNNRLFDVTSLIGVDLLTDW